MVILCYRDVNFLTYYPFKRTMKALTSSPAHIHTHTSIHLRIDTHKCMQISVVIHTNTPAHINYAVHRQESIHTHSYIRTQAQTHTHTTN